MNPTVTDIPLKMVQFDFDSDITDLILDLNFLRKKRLAGTTPAPVFFQLKRLFHTFESIGSARIEGNNTTVEAYLDGKSEHSFAIDEILNIEKTLQFIDETVHDYPINRSFLRELHKRAVANLPMPERGGEGSSAPGEFRRVNVQITNTPHLPPEAVQVEHYIDELLSFINNDLGEKYDLLKVAIAHHRFVWIHPFDNGNGRVVRLLTYAMLVRAGFNVEIGGRILNPSAVFCNDRKRYYQNLAIADTGTNEGLMAWCKYVLTGLRDEIEKIDKLCDYTFLKEKILVPAIHQSRAEKTLSDEEKNILTIAAENGRFRAQDIAPLFPGKARSDVSRKIQRLMKKELIVPEREGARTYVLGFSNRTTGRSVINFFRKEGFLPPELQE